jgi:hypothetical protein
MEKCGEIFFSFLVFVVHSCCAVDNKVKIANTKTITTPQVLDSYKKQKKRNKNASENTLSSLNKSGEAVASQKTKSNAVNHSL